MSKIITAIAAVSATIVGVTARPSDLQTRATSSNFSLFAYGSDTDSTIGGYPIFYNEGKDNNSPTSRDTTKTQG